LAVAAVASMMVRRARAVLPCLLIKDSRKYAATSGWGFGQFRDSKPAHEAVPKACFSYHEPAKARDFVFTHYAP
jgi:hypothetical protein